MRRALIHVIPSFGGRWLVLAAVLAVLLAAGLPPATVHAAPLEDNGVYVVRAGDYLSRIAARLGVSVSALARANGITNPNLIYPGQRLVIPGAAGAPAPVTPPASSSGYYVVQAGDTLAKIAARFGTTVQALVAANALRNPNVIWIGQRLKVGSGGSAPSQPAKPPAAPPAAASGRWIDINLSAQRLTAYEGNTPMLSALISAGLPRTPTVVGRFRIYMKLASQRMRGPGYDLPGVPYVMYFYAGYAIHGTYWHNNFGHPMSHGCVNMRTQDAAWLYSWASVGTLVVTHW